MKGLSHFRHFPPTQIHCTKFYIHAYIRKHTLCNDKGYGQVGVGVRAGMFVRMRIKIFDERDNEKRKKGARVNKISVIDINLRVF